MKESHHVTQVHERLRREHLGIESPASSDFHMHVSEILSQLGIDHVNEVSFVWGGGYD